DMSGLLKPYAAHKLVSTLKQEIGLPIHLHTHDTSGNGVATLLKAAEAGVDIVDVAIASMSSLTSQPSMNSVVTALAGTERDTGMDDRKLLPISEYWEHARKFYSGFEEGLTSPTTDIYLYEIPGGQYTNLRAQVESVGLGARWSEIKQNYRVVNDMLGDIVKVTPSSKMVGDFAIFMTQNNLTPENFAEKGKGLAFPDSIVSYFSGMMGQPEGGFPKDIQAIVLKGEKAITCRPGEHLAPMNFDEVRETMQEFCPNPDMKDIVSYALYPKVVKDYFAHKKDHSELSGLDTPIFFGGLRPGEATEVEIEEGKTLLIKLVLIGEPDEENYRRVVFELNGSRREVSILDKTESKSSAGVTQSLTADPNNPKDVGATLPGMVSKIMVTQGKAVKENDVVAVIEAMKMETTIVSKCSGVVGQIYVSEGQPVKAGELMMVIE
ncbi:MAG: pyruvate carboxylase, partial [Defluviitaleaceae bacterium]|nr:pyruvate carboxylase [Defluviitaleaceae bacterium]